MARLHQRLRSWSAQDPSRLDLGTLFSSDFLFADLLQQTPDSGLILNDDEIDPASGSISLVDLAAVRCRTVEIDLPAMLESRRLTRMPQLRKRLARLTAHCGLPAGIRKALAPLYANLGLTPQILALPRNQAIQIVEGPRIASIVLPADQVPARDVDRVLWDLLDTGQFRKATGKRIVDFDRDLGYAPGGEPYVDSNTRFRPCSF